MQELERQRREKAGEPVEGEGAKPTTKFMIAGEAPMVMTKACELMIKELTLRAWKHTDNNKRKTLQRADVHAAVAENEIFDFLIDLVPRVATASLTIPPINNTVGQEVSPPQASTNTEQSGAAGPQPEASQQHQHHDAAANLTMPGVVDLGQMPQLFLPVDNPTENAGGDATENGTAQEQTPQQPGQELQWGEDRS